jgi:hypothetical protein
MINAWDIKFNPAEAYEVTDQKRWPHWREMVAHDFYFAVIPPNEYASTMVFICPIKYFESNQDMIRESMPINHLVPLYLVESMEAIFETDFSEEMVKNDLIKKGFLSNDAFTDYVTNRFEYRE